jgi:hypothetical protein
MSFVEASGCFFQIITQCRHPTGDDAVPSDLEIEENALKKVSTWPWQPETARYLVSALFLPLVIWLIQFVVQSVLSK